MISLLFTQSLLQQIIDGFDFMLLLQKKDVKDIYNYYLNLVGFLKINLIFRLNNWPGNYFNN